MSSSRKRMIGSSRVETLVLNTPLDLDRAMASTTQPRTVVIAAHLLAPQPPQQHWHSLRLPSDNWSPLHRVLRRVGCLEVCVQGKSSAVPRRVYEHELVALLQSIPKAHRRLRKIVLKNLDVQRVPQEEDVEAVTTNSTQCLSNELLQLRGLQELHIQSCRLDEPTTLVDLIATLAHLKSDLRQVTLEWLDPIQSPATHHLLVQTLTALVQPKSSSALTSLAVSEYPHSMAFWRGIAASKTLTHLSLSLDDPHTESSNDSIHTNVFKEAERQLFWDLLQQNTSIEQLEFQVGGYTTTNTSPLDPLMALLKTNTTWKSLLVHLNGPKDDASQVHHTTNAFTLRPPLPNATTSNNNNTPLYYYLNPTQVAQDVSDILEQDNYTLRQVHVLCLNLYGFKVRIPHTQLDFYCKLNRQGRHKLLLLEDNDDSDSDCEEEVVSSSRRSTDSIVSYFKKTTSAGGPNNSSSRASHAVTSGVHAKMDRPTTTTSNNDDHNQVWVDTALAANTYDVPAVYYWLQSNPNLFSKFLSSSENGIDNKTGSNKNGMTKVLPKPASPMTAICVH